MCENCHWEEHRRHAVRLLRDGQHLTAGHRKILNEILCDAREDQHITERQRERLLGVVSHVTDRYAGTEDDLAVHLTYHDNGTRTKKRMTFE